MPSKASPPRPDEEKENANSPAHAKGCIDLRIFTICSGSLSMRHRALRFLGSDGFSLPTLRTSIFRLF
jgi:hypothetical protein